jgi:hypothetical protein
MKAANVFADRTAGNAGSFGNLSIGQTTLELQS